MDLQKRKGNNPNKKINLNFTIQCQRVVDDKVIILRDFEKYLRERIKINGRKGKLGSLVTLSSSASAIDLHSTIPFSKRYLKYLTKKYLKKLKISDYLRVVSTSGSKYEIKYLKIYNDEEEEEDQQLKGILNLLCNYLRCIYLQGVQKLRFFDCIYDSSDTSRVKVIIC